MYKVFTIGLLLSASVIALNARAALASNPSVSRPGVIMEQGSNPTVDADAAAQLRKLFADSDASQLQFDPIAALQRGNHQLIDLFSDAHAEAAYQASKSDLARLQAIDRAALNTSDQLAYDAFESRTNINIRNFSPEIRALTDVRPIDSFNGIQTWYPVIASGQAITQFENLKDFEDNIKRNKQFAQQLDLAIRRFREGMKSGVVQPKLVVTRSIAQLDGLLEQKPDRSVFVEPLKAFPKTISVSDQKRLRAETLMVVRQAVFPAISRLRAFLKNEYLPVAREGVGLVHMKGGLKLYNFLIEAVTTLPLTADQVYDQGVSEVTRITAEMETIKTQVGFKGNLAQFFEFVRTAPQFKFKSKQDMHDTFASIGKRLEARLGEQFSTIPKTKLELQATPASMQPSSPTGQYVPGAPDGSKPGIFFYNTFDLPSRSKIEAETLYLHEAVPGHHFQFGLAYENQALPDFMRFGTDNVAFIEGWALYSESLYKELGMESDPYQRFGGLNAEILRAMRLVVDTGLHAKGWTRDQAIKYMLAHSGMSQGEVTREVERYIANPGQALAYKIGQLTIQRIKEKAQTALGAAFDVRKFHTQVLNTGNLPLNVLESKIDAWIAGGGQ